MGKKVYLGLLVVGGLLTLIGFVKLLTSVDDGIDTATEFFVMEMDGAMDTETFQTVKEGLIMRNIAIGSIVFSSGLLFFLFNLYKVSALFFNEKDKM
ncbi:hypothetical protein [Bacillus sp. AK031]